MASENRRTDPSVADILFEAGYQFDFFQAVRVLERLFPGREPVGHNASPAQEVVRFRTHLSLSFPPSAIYELTPPPPQNSQRPAEQRPAEMIVAFMGLTGPMGVLPRHYTELLLERVREKDHTLRDFLDLFNHRMLSLFYRAWEKYRFPIAYERVISRQEGYDRFSLSLFDLMGMGTTGLRGRLEIEDEALLFYTGLLGQHPRSASALAGLLADYFELPVTVVQFTGQWLPLTVESRSRLGVGETNNVLGVNVLAGSHVWDQQAKFTLRMGPLTFAQFCQLLPTGSAWQALVQLTRFFVGQEFDFDVQLVLNAAQVPWCCLGETGECAPRLGWSTWLKTREFLCDADEAIFVGELSPRKPQPTEAAAEEGGMPYDREPEIPDWETERYLS